MNLIAIIGKSASGKDTLLKKALSQFDELHKIIPSTTRPMREGETDGVDYFFYSKEEFDKKEMLEWKEFNDWFYGTPRNQLVEDKINIGIFSPSALYDIQLDAWETNKIKITPIYLDVDDKTRLLRSLNREENPDCAEICRRFITDKRDFDVYDKCFYNIITVHTTEDALEKINEVIQNVASICN